MTRHYCRRFKRWNDPTWVDCLSLRAMGLYAGYFRPLVGFNFWLERVTNGS